jgi:type IV pilus assembly protein PilV
MRRLTRQKGFTLLEVMIALAVFAIGMLAIAMMQDTALNGSASVKQMSAAINLTEEMVERIQFHALSVQNNGQYNNYDNLDTQDLGTRPTSAPAQGDYDEWQRRLAETGLPGVRGVVTVDPGYSTGFEVKVTVSWQGLARMHSISMETFVNPVVL